MSRNFEEILHQYWGYDSFRDLQVDIIQSIYDKKDTLGLMPTGGGKSITFQVPALASEGICLVITPLIALMKDQVTNLQKKGIKAAAIYSGMRRNEIIITLENCIFGNYKFLYLSPERLETELFLSKLPDLNISFIAIDEAHCISQWGYDFRPSYLNIANLRTLKPDCAVLALTATATPQVVEDIQEKLLFKKKNVFQKSFQRDNLSYWVEASEDKFRRLLELLKEHPGSGIVYVRNRKKTKELAEFLMQNNIKASFYHAGLDGWVKDQRQKQWSSGELRIMVSTNAFGMGIDKANVRLVVHFDIPDSPEAYFQEAGRAGRDEAPAMACLLYSKSDVSNLKKSFTNAFPPKEFIRTVYGHLMNYFQIAYEDGNGRTFDFEIGKFCKAFQLNIVQAHNALKLIDRSGYIKINDSKDNRSKLYFKADKTEIFSYQKQNSDYEKLLKTILRSFSGLFSSYVYYEDSLLSDRTGLSADHIYQILSSLDKAGLISYIPKKSKPTITLLIDRAPEHRLLIPKIVYEAQFERLKERTNTMLYYLSSNMICRNQILLSYFGETNSKPCGRCDVCIRKNSHNNTYNTIRNAIISCIKPMPMHVNELLEKLDFPKKDCLDVIRFMTDNNDLSLTKDILSIVD